MQKRFYALITGRVQMVMYRAFAQRAATQRGVVGWVRNLPDGKVEVSAEGEEGSLHSFLAELRKGPALARVDAVEIQWADPTSNEKNFSIVYE